MEEFECPSCHGVNELSDEEVNEDPVHVEGVCTYCGKFVCYTCQHVYPSDWCRKEEMP